MKATVNHPLVAITSIDSGELGPLAAVIHQFAEPGDYHGDVLKGDRRIAMFHLRVDDACEASQTDVDLGRLASPIRTAIRPCACEDASSGVGEKVSPAYVASPRGYVLFYVGKGAGGYAVRVNRIEGGKPTFDSRELHEGDMFAATLIRPGAYAVTNTVGGARSTVTVAYPRPDRGTYVPPDPITIEVAKTALTIRGKGAGSKLDKTTIEAGQGQLFAVKAPARIRIELTKPDDGPKRTPPARLLSWSKPKRAGR